MRHSDLAGRTALITGAARGLGAAYARRLAAEGARVALVDALPCDAVVADIRTANGDATAFVCDLGDPSAIESLCAAINEWSGAPDILVNNAGSYPTMSLEDTDLIAWRKVFSVNVEAPMLLIRAFSPGMAARGWGRIINVSSSTVMLVRRDIAAYVSSKMAIIGLTRALASDLGPSGITVNAVAPGLTRTEGTETQLAELDALALFDRFAHQQPIRRVIEPSDLSGVVAFLCSDDAGMITGQTLLVDGGLSRL